MYQGFQGSTKLTLDAKGRLSMPTRYRDALMVESQGRITLVPHPDGALLVYPTPLWERKFAELVDSASMRMRRQVAGVAEPIELDGSGRFLVSPELRERTGLNRDVRLIGMGPHFELWDEQRYRDDLESPENARALVEEAARFKW